jgi:hypothetical protein
MTDQVAEGRVWATDFQGSRRYDLVSRLGEGGMGVVYKALDRETQSLVALKTVHSLSGDALLRFKREFRALSGIAHPNLVSLYELVEDGGLWFFTMELVPGVDFLQWVTRGEGGSAVQRTVTVDARTEPALPDLCTYGPQPLSRTLDADALRDAFVQLARGLSALHSAGKVHRDVKPTNIQVTAGGRVVLLDFGLACEAWTPSGLQPRPAGTVRYMAPEQAGAERVGPPADWYAAGVVLYEALTGKAPFEGTAAEVIARKRASRATSPRELLVDVPDDLEILCMDLLQADPARRPSASAIFDILSPRCSPRARANTLDVATQASDAVHAACQELERAFEEVEAGSGVAVLVRGNAEEDKARVLEWFREVLLASHPDALVLSSRCDEREHLPYRALDGIVDGLTEHVLNGTTAQGPRSPELLSRLFPVVSSLAGDLHREETGSRSGLVGVDLRQLRRQSFRELKAWLTRVAHERTLVLLIANVHWADPDSRLLLDFLLDGGDAARMLVIATENTEPSARSAYLDHPGARWREIRLAQDEPENHQSEASEENALHRRMDSVDGASKKLLEILAIAQGPITVDVAAACTSQEVPTCAALVDGLQKSHFVQSRPQRGGGRIELADARMRVLALAPLDAATRSEANLRLAKCLDVTRDDPELALQHYLAGGDRVGAAHAAVRAARRADDGLAFDRAERLWRQVTALRALSPAENRESDLSHASALVNAGRPVEAAHSYLAVATTAGPEEGLDLRRTAAELLLNAGRLEEGLRTLRDLLDSVGLPFPRTPRRAALALIVRRALLRTRGLRFRSRTTDEIPKRDLLRLDVCRTVALGLGFIDNIRAAYYQSLHTWFALRAGEPSRLALALAFEAPFMAAMGPSNDRAVRRLLRNAEALSQETGDEKTAAYVRFSTGFSALQQGRWRAALAPLDLAGTRFGARSGGVSWEVVTSQVSGLWSLFFTGDFRELGRRADALLSDADDRGNLYAGVNLRIGFPIAAWLARGDAAGARAAVDHGMRDWGHTGFDVQHCFAVMGRTLIHLYEGKGEEAFCVMMSEWPALERSMLLYNQLIRITMRYLRGAAAVSAARDRHAASLAVAESEARRLAREGVPWGEALAELLLGSVMAARGDGANAAKRLASAALALGEADMRLYASAATYRRGELLGAERGAELMSSALDEIACEVKAPEGILRMLAPSPSP